MKSLKAICDWFFRSETDEWVVNDSCTMRVHKTTGEVEYWVDDAWDGYFAPLESK